ncbi:DUF2497 domain-containing protein [Altererythrobacter indicus]|uniref:DUF2497 domain-containing protein n=1 Tax=Altericroceibacterium indicum TaxID=374177 RepID=A0A845A7W2_9SPHN|nr:DUF2497 domain-containing protein [Altericroceibacterium indicum]MXP26452.1 DUF2497 domain-containing protein [Altericroceibacterium indicum]
MRQEGEPSVEEILESIKKVIARDNPGRIPATPRNRQFEVLSGTHVAEDTLPEEDEAADSVEAEEVLDLSEADEWSEAEQNSPAQTDSAETSEPQSDSPLTRPESASSMRESLAALAMLSQPGAGTAGGAAGSTSLEDLVRSMLRPMLAQWLDAHLPAIVERMVQDEIDRIAGKKR